MLKFAKILFFIGIFTDMASAFRCHSDRCTDFRLGLGSYYGNFQTHYGNLNNVGGLFSISSETYRKYFHIGINGTVTYNYQTNKNFNAQSFIYFISPYIGINTGSLKTPFLIGLVIPIGYYSFGIGSPQRELNVSVFFGGRIYQRIPLSEIHHLEYDLSYSIAPWVRHAFAGFNKLVKNANVHRVEFSFGYIHRRDIVNVYEKEDRLKRPDFYAKVKGIYYRQNELHLTPSLNYPSGNNFAVMLEMGVSLDTTW
ncbi:Uncharacterised protein [Helicobacter mustelae]|uniref:hypothetical protein n=1 Tax=Helicobacter mustelae TaxID=217 RepID=UPI000E027DD4|nr:hypothetical protein [Helicobacter mustelae]STP14151.1 Uncharacterised protein [Helicobacter mustelae]